MKFFEKLVGVLLLILCLAGFAWLLYTRSWVSFVPLIGIFFAILIIRHGFSLSDIISEFGPLKTRPSSERRREPWVQPQAQPEASTELEELKEELKKIEKLIKQEKYDQAEKRLIQLKRTFPDSLEVISVLTRLRLKR